MGKNLLLIGMALAFPVAMAISQSVGSQPSASAKETQNNAQPKAKQATADDLVKGATVSDPSGLPIGVIDSVSETGVILTVGSRRIQIPRDSVARSEPGLIIPATRAELEAGARKDEESRSTR